MKKKIVIFLTYTFKERSCFKIISKKQTEQSKLDEVSSISTTLVTKTSCLNSKFVYMARHNYNEIYS